MFRVLNDKPEATEGGESFSSVNHSIQSGDFGNPKTSLQNFPVGKYPPRFHAVPEGVLPEQIIGHTGAQSLAASAARRVISAQFPAASAAFGVVHEPPTHITLPSAR